MCSIAWQFTKMHAHNCTCPHIQINSDIYKGFVTILLSCCLQNEKKKKQGVSCVYTGTDSVFMNFNLSFYFLLLFRFPCVVFPYNFVQVNEKSIKEEKVKQNGFF